MNEELQHTLYNKLKELNLRKNRRIATMRLLTHSNDPDKAMYELYAKIKDKHTLDETELAHMEIQIMDKYRKAVVTVISKDEVAKEWYD